MRIAWHMFMVVVISCGTRSFGKESEHRGFVDMAIKWRTVLITFARHDDKVKMSKEFSVQSSNMTVI